MPARGVPSSSPLVCELEPAPDPLVVCELWSARPDTFLLDSGGGGFGRIGRYSFAGTDPFLVFRSKAERIEIIQGGIATRTSSGDPFSCLESLLADYRLEVPGGLPPFAGGAVGYFGYDLSRFVERLPEKAVDDVGIPDCWLGLYDVVLAFDHASGKAWLMSSGFPERDLRDRERRARARMEGVLGELAVLKAKAGRERRGRGFSGGGDVSGLAVRAGAASRRDARGPADCCSGTVSSNFTRDSYCRAVDRAKEYIAAGDIFQVNLSQRFVAPLGRLGQFQLYRRLRSITPAPFGAYLNPRGFSIACASPERFLRVNGRYVETRPIKGTRPRGSTRACDEVLRRQLLGSPKDWAEHVMIVDLERNDLGRSCTYGSVSVPEFVVCESHPTVFHLVSTVCGELCKEASPVQCLRRSFPGGSITGAPKVRAMEIIDELEPVKRGIYTGALGYLGFNGQMDLNIVIRSFLLYQGLAYFHAGGGIVADSVAEAEFEETIDKARALFAALGIALPRAGSVARE
ncbi:MAG: anthranilate synthase component I family protein [Firmicutes bacterium]|nr:anthranilate synthase component I family protein [Bacillota bacterium]